MRPSAIGAALLLGALAAGPAMALEQGEVSASPDSASTHRLSPDEVDRIMAEAAARRERAQVREAPGRRVHGEVGVMVGTGGTWGVHGNAMMPLGDSGFAGFSFDTGSYPDYGGMDGYGAYGLYDPYRGHPDHRRYPLVEPY